jgi:hypothetical protein
MSRTLMLLSGAEAIPARLLLPALHPIWPEVPQHSSFPSKLRQKLVPALPPFSAELVPQLTLQLHVSKISWILHLTLVINYPNEEN